MPDPTTPPHLPYQAYKSKRHSRGLSSSNANPAPNVTPPPVSRPQSVAFTPPTASALAQLERDSLSGYTFPRAHPQQTLSSPKIVLAPPSPISPLTNGLPSPPASDHSQESPDSPVGFSGNDSRINSPTDRTVPEQPVCVSTHTPKASTSSAIASASSSPIASSSVLASPELGPFSTLPRKTSKFRHVPLRRPHAPVPSSPLAATSKDLHSRADSVLSLPPPRQGHGTSPVLPNLNQSEPQLPITPLVKTTSPFASPNRTERALPPLPPVEPRSKPPQRPVVPVIASSLVSPPSISKSSSLSSDVSSRPQSPSTTQGHKAGKSRTLTASVPYRPGFQPKGVYRHLTDDFLALRRAKRDGTGDDGSMKRIEKNKLERRLEKLIDLHFPTNPPSPVPKSSVNTSSSPTRRPGPDKNTLGIRRSSSIFDLDNFKNINLRDAGDLWRNVLTGNLKGTGELDTRAMEQRITPWEEDSAVSKCPLCLTSFHTLTNRKHHCRLCGRIICSLPPKNPQRPATCSILFIVDSKTRKIEEVSEGIDYGVKKRKNASIGNIGEIDNDEKFLKGVRICRECHPILLQEQYQQERLHVPNFVKLHETFIALEREIEGALPKLQELILALNHNDQPTKEATVARKRILEAFAQYDALAKKIKQLPCPNGPGSSQGRIQAAILMRATLFLQNNMFPLQSLPTPSRNKGKEPSGTTTPDANNVGDLIEAQGVDSDSELAQALQPLLEQEALLETFVEEAMAQRKFEDVKTLKVNLQEIRREIEKLLDGTDVNTKNGKGKGR
ncbi:FYVE-domain-containing protein [Macrolepiota fuliginosa MF-IS2]|uniref:FYVE-domain-containing protein n=1 Tax=Macrolepiota fuliginosa MF-IS2 TaxID=1400762 RepID=A0A9P5XP40_9AGAR|nr:FYVE-domain-containing protein [Macrolepiota fuliginosa MF-IS2]